jgi:hypothetical protein
VPPGGGGLEPGFQLTAKGISASACKLNEMVANILPEAIVLWEVLCQVSRMRKL